jgi:hypothetical protein
MVYSDYKVGIGYRLIEARTKVDLGGGNRMGNFAIVLEGASSKITMLRSKGRFLA